MSKKKKKKKEEKKPLFLRENERETDKEKGRVDFGFHQLYMLMKRHT